MSSERFAGERQARAAVHRAVQEGARRRQERRRAGSRWSQRQFTEELDRLHVRMANARLERVAEHHLRSTPFTPLGEEDLPLLERQITAYEHRERLQVLELPKLEERLALLRVNHVTQRDLVDGALFRQVTQELFRIALPECLRFAGYTRDHGFRPPSPEEVSVVLPWRSALLAGEAFRDMGVRHFQHLDVRRNEETLLPELRYERLAHLPETIIEGCQFVISDPMLATGGTALLAVDWLLQYHIAERHITVFSVVAAPEGVDLLLHTYPELRVLTCALDASFDERGYITGPGLGDFGDLAMRGVDAEYVQTHWVGTGILTSIEGQRILDRTNGVAACAIAS
ncbi:hypothetical protein HY632_04195 [Candidatus Uhrbacteria bacterium]|nr:hypothetical protein [Candidatus Uhrbacteria bacterium]